MPDKKRKRRKRGVSVGSILALLLTGTVLAGCLFFVARLAGDEMDASTVFQALTNTLEIPGLHRVKEPEGQEKEQLTIAPTAAPTITPQSVTPTPAPTPRVVEIQAVGAIAAPKNVRQSVYASESQTYDFSEIFEDVRDKLMVGDLTIATAETTFAGKEAGYGSYNAPSQLLDALKSAGVDLLSLGTERALELGYDALVESIGQVQSRGFLLSGVYEREEDVGTAQIFQINDVQIAVLAYTYGLSDTAKNKTKSAYRFSVPLINADTICEDIVNARKAGAELVIVLPHWGTKNKETTNSDVYALAQTLANAGADIILGTHPNVVQGVERLTAIRSDGTQHTCYAAYSLGSFLTDSRDEPNTAGVVLSLRVEVDPLTRQLTIDVPEYVPTYIQRYKSDGLYRYRILPTNDESIRAGLDESTLKALEKAQARVIGAIGEDALLQQSGQ